MLLGTVSDQPVERSARPVATARGVGLADVPETPPVVVLGYQPEFHPARDHWFADIAMDDGPACGRSSGWRWPATSPVRSTVAACHRSD